MPLLLDTSVVIKLRESEPAAVARIATLDEIPLISIVSVVELEGGVPFASEGRAIRRAALDRILATLEILPFEQVDAAAYGRIVEQLGYSRRLVFDRMIAGQAIVAGATLATLNPRDFRDIPSLEIEDWSC